MSFKSISFRSAAFSSGFTEKLASAFLLTLFCFSFNVIPFASAQSYEDDMYDEERYEDRYEDEMYANDRYGRSRQSGGSIDVYTGPVLAIFKSMDLKPILANPSKFDIRKGPALEAGAKEVFSAGNHALACQLIHGHMSAEYDNARASLDRVRLSPLLKRPVWNLRWAVSMAVRGGDEVDDPSPIEMGSSDGYEPDDMDFGGREARGRDDEFMNDSRGRNEQALAPSMLSTNAAEQLEKYLGGITAACAAEFDKRFQAGNFGTSFQAATPSTDPAPQPAPDRDARNETADANGASGLSKATTNLISDAPPALPMWRPGIVFLGTGSSSEMTDLAQAKQIDALIHFDIVLKQQGRQDQTYVQNVSRARLIHVAAGKSLIVSKAMDNLEVRQLQSAGRLSNTRRYIDDQMSGLWRTVDREFHLAEMPKISPESARGRIGKLLETGGGRNLRTLAEIRLYQSQGLIETVEAENAYDIIGGTDALTMMHGPRDERLEIARKWAIEAIQSE